MNLTSPSKSRYLKATVLLLSVLVSLSSVSASAAGKRKHSHKHDTVVIHEVYIFNSHPPVTQNGQIVQNRISFNPQPVISVPKPVCSAPATPAVKQAVAAPISNKTPPIQKIQINYYND